jgi:protein-arginine kinase activator protein McsA
MASFIGTNPEFKRYVGPRLRNLVQQLTRKHKAEIAVCEHCGTKANLESAHVNGRDRNQIIDLVLEAFTTNGIATIDLSVFEDKFKEEHHPLEKSILILCRECHTKYDSEIVESISELPLSTELSNHVHMPNKGVSLPITLDPSDPLISLKWNY